MAARPSVPQSAPDPEPAPAARQAAPAAGAEGSELALLLALLWRRKALILTLAVLGTLAVVLVVMRVPPTYRAAAVLLFEETRGAQPISASEPAAPAGPDLASEIEVMLSHGLLSEVMRRAG